jgi:hypothetical protein
VTINSNIDWLGLNMIGRILLIYCLLTAVPTLAVPEAARYGQESCTSCHVSPGGSGALTNYGRMFAAEKLSTWYRPTEEYFLNGLVTPGETWLAGGDLRWVYYNQQVGDRRQEKFWRMQSDFELILHLGDLWIQGAVGTMPAGPYDQGPKYSKLFNRGYSARYDILNQHILLRGGVFMPKFGLMTADHTIYTRISSGLMPDDEQYQLELTFQDDGIDLTLAYLFDNAVPNKDKQPKKGFSLGIGKMVGSRNRVSFGAMSTEKSINTGNIKTLGLVLSSVLTFTSKLFSMFEISRTNQKLSTETQNIASDSIATYFTINYETMRGLLPFLRYETWNPEVNSKGQQIQRYGGGLNWYPRPHFQTEARSMITMYESRSGDQNVSSEIILHYYF